MLGARPAASARGSASCPPPAATPTTTSCASTAPSRPALRALARLALPPRAGAGGPRAHLLSQDVIYVGGGSVISLLGVWRAHGIDAILREAWEAGVVLCGLSAGSLCWFAEAVTGFHGEPARVEGLGLLPFSNCVHYDGEPERAGLPRFARRRDARRLRGRGRRRPALRRHRAGRVVASRPDARAATGSTPPATGGRDAAGDRSTSATPRLDPAAAGARRSRPPRRRHRWSPASSPSVATISPRARRTARSASCCSAGAERAGAAEDLPAADRQRRPLDQIARFYAAFGERALRALGPLALPARARDRSTLRDHLLDQDLIYVGGGSLVNLLAIWEAHDLGAILSLAWRQRIVLAGQSAGAMCWFEAGITKSSGQPEPRAGPRAAPRQPLRPLQQRARAPRRLPRRGRRRHAGRLRPRRLRRPALGGQRPPLGADRPPRRPRLPRHAGRRRGVAEHPIPARFLPAPAPAALREDIAEFRRITAMRKRAGWLGQRFRCSFIRIWHRKGTEEHSATRRPRRAVGSPPLRRGSRGRCTPRRAAGSPSSARRR